MIANMIFRARQLLGTAALAAGLAALAPPAGADAPKQERVAVARPVTLPGTLFVREAPDKPWHPVPPKGSLFTNDTIVGTPGAILEPTSGAIRLAFLTDFNDTSPFPIRECG